MDYYDLANKINLYLVKTNTNNIEDEDLYNLINKSGYSSLDVYLLMLQLNKNGVDVSQFTDYKTYSNEGIQLVTILHKLLQIEDPKVLISIIQKYPNLNLNEINVEMLNEIILYLTELSTPSKVPIKYENITNDELTMNLYQISNYLNMYEYLNEHHALKIEKLEQPKINYKKEININENTMSLISEMFDIDMSYVYIPQYNYTYSKLLELVIINLIIKINSNNEYDFNIKNINETDIDPNTLEYQVYTFLELLRQNTKYQHQILNVLMKIAVKMNITQAAIDTNKYKKLYWTTMKFIESDISNLDMGIYKIFKNGEDDLPQLDIGLLIHKNIILSRKQCIIITKEQINDYIYYYNNLQPNLFYDEKKIICWEQLKIFLRVFKYRGIYKIHIDNNNVIFIEPNPLALQSQYDFGVDIELVSATFDNLVSKLNYSYPFDIISTLIKMVNFTMDEIESLFIRKIYNTKVYDVRYFQNYFTLAVLHKYHFNIFDFNLQQMYRYIKIMNTNNFEITPLLQLMYFQVVKTSINNYSVVSSALPDIIKNIKLSSNDEFTLYYNCKLYQIPELEIMMYIKNNNNIPPMDNIILALLILNNPMISIVERKYLSYIIEHYSNKVEYSRVSAIISNKNNADLKGIVIHKQALLDINKSVPNLYTYLINNNINIELDMKYLANIIPKIKNIDFYKNILTLFT